MSDTEDLVPNEESSKKQDSNPKLKVSSVLEDLEMIALQKGTSGIDINSFNDEQKNKLLEILRTNEENAFDYHKKRIDAIRDIELKRIDASIVNQKSLRILIYSVVIAVPVITLLILFYKENYFIPWLTFLTGLIGGVGISKILPSLYKTPSSDNPINNNEDE